MPFLLPNQQCQSTEGTCYDMTVYIPVTEYFDLFHLLHILTGFLDQEKLRKAAAVSAATVASLTAQNYSIEDKRLELVCTCSCHLAFVSGSECNPSAHVISDPQGGDWCDPLPADRLMDFCSCLPLIK